MDRLWSPWRYRYVTQAGKDDTCIFCQALAAADDRASLIVHRGQHTFILLNRFPYTTGHVMIAPYDHVPDLSQARPEALTEMMLLCQQVERALAALYRPDGYNLGMNLGRSAGAGVAGHIHMHVLPRWLGDTSFMTTVSETRIEPEDLGVTFEKLKAQFAS
jgi:ATP adenylyltransferase